MSVLSLRSFYDNIKSNIRDLESLGQNQATFGSVLSTIIFRKLPTEMGTRMISDYDANAWTIDMLRHAIGKEVRALKAGHLTNTDELSQTVSFITRETPRDKHRNRIRAQISHNRGYSLLTAVKMCVYCD